MLTTPINSLTPASLPLTASDKAGTPRSAEERDCIPASNRPKEKERAGQRATQSRFAQCLGKEKSKEKERTKEAEQKRRPTAERLDKEGNEGK